MRYLTQPEIIIIHDDAVAATGGSLGIRDEGLLSSSVAQPQMTFGGEDLYPTPFDKAAALGFFLVSNHALLDGNKRVGYISMRLLLQLNGYDLAGTTAEKEQVILALAAGEMTQEDFFAWVRDHTIPLAAKELG